MKYEEIKILDLEESDDGRKIIVPFEVPGKHFNQNYPKRLTHEFEKKPSLFDIVNEETGLKRYQDILKNLYVEKEDDRKKRSEAEAHLQDEKKQVRGKKL